MKTWWRQRSLRIELASWYAGAGAAVLVMLLMAALITGVWTPARRLDVLLVLLIGLPLAVALLAVAGYLIAERALAPIRTMVDRARRLSARSLSERLPVMNPHDELGQLAAVFNETLNRLENSFAELKRFTADASHNCARRSRRFAPSARSACAKATLTGCATSSAACWRKSAA